MAERRGQAVSGGLEGRSDRPALGGVGTPDPRDGQRVLLQKLQKSRLHEPSGRALAVSAGGVDRNAAVLRPMVGVSVAQGLGSCTAGPTTDRTNG